MGTTDQATQSLVSSEGGGVVDIMHECNRVEEVANQKQNKPTTNKPQRRRGGRR